LRQECLVMPLLTLLTMQESSEGKTAAHARERVNKILAHT
jgi:hypothetical protein